MLTHRIQISTLICRILGSAILYVAIFLYEDEEGRYQNWLEELWIKIRYERDRVLTAATTLFVLAANSTSRIFDRVFGPRLFSSRAALVSICLSFASFYLFVPLVSLVLKTSSIPKNAPLTSLIQALGFLALALIPAFMDSKWELRIWQVCVMFVIGRLIAPIGYVVITRMGFHSAVRFGTFMMFLLGLSFTFDLVFLGFTRWMLRRASTMAGTPQIIGLLAANSFIAVGLVVTPFKLFERFAPTDPQHYSVFGLASFVVIILNIVDLGLSLLVFFVLAVFTLHRLFWPLMERPIYAVARYGLIKRKWLLWSVGLALVIGPTKDKSIFVWIVERISALKG